MVTLLYIASIIPAPSYFEWRGPSYMHGHRKEKKMPKMRETLPLVRHRMSGHC